LIGTAADESAASESHAARERRCLAERDGGLLLVNAVLLGEPVDFLLQFREAFVN
jgi:hypothetical protein